MCSLEKRGNIYILTITGDDDHRLNPTLLDSITAALHRIQSETTTAPSALITTAHGKFFSNGYDLAWGQSDPDRTILMSKKLRLLIQTLISFPMPTIAAVTGHASAGDGLFCSLYDLILYIGSVTDMTPGVRECYEIMKHNVHLGCHVNFRATYHKLVFVATVVSNPGAFESNQVSGKANDIFFYPPERQTLLLKGATLKGKTPPSVHTNESQSTIHQGM
uniref:Enoyl-CoA delta isomerase 1, peroxisomal n=1 Tax=Tanacetum cinerariifolium TaxID=118510 RepID=A0A6L2NZH0_TANCI|nr:enoyl-CoA delta isomerase 1, peroxisomal [Tanacetum cinerariifolium]